MWMPTPGRQSTSTSRAFNSRATSRVLEVHGDGAAAPNRMRGRRGGQATRRVERGDRGRAEEKPEGVVPLADQGRLEVEWSRVGHSARPVHADISHHLSAQARTPPRAQVSAYSASASAPPRGMAPRKIEVR